MPILQYASESKRQVTITMLAKSLDALEMRAKAINETLEQWIVGAIYDKFQDEDAMEWFKDFQDQHAK
jgi:hypothetical protein